MATGLARPRAKRPGTVQVVAGLHAGVCACRGARRYSPSVSRLALPPAAVVFTVTVFSVAKRGR